MAGTHPGHRTHLKQLLPDHQDGEDVLVVGHILWSNQVFAILLKLINSRTWSFLLKEGADEFGKITCWEGDFHVEFSILM